MRIFCVRIIGILCLCAGLYHPSGVQVFQVVATSSKATASSPADAATELHRIFDEEWQRTLKENPTQASQLGDRRYNTLWPDTSLTAIRASQARTRQVLATMKMLDRTSLSAADSLNARLFEYQYEAEISEQRFQLHLLPVNQRGGIQDEDTTVDVLQFDTLRDYEDWIARLKAFPLYTARTMALMRQGIHARMLHPKIVMQRVPAQIRKQLVNQPQQSPYYKPFRAFAVELTDTEKNRLRKDAAAAIESCILPSYRTFLEFFEKEYLPACFADAGCWQRPDGHSMYTGMHSLKWSRQEAIDFFADNTAKSMLDIENEIDRYIVWPGQALAYKIGELKIQELRQRCEQALGSRFDVREFHDVVLRNGAVPLDVLDELVTAWIATKQR